MEPLRASLLNPGFAKDPPVKLDINARTLGIVLAVLAALGVLGGIASLLNLLSVGFAVASAFGGVAAVAIVGLLLDLLGAVLGAVGGWRMYQGIPAGKELVIYGLAAGCAGEIVVGAGYDTLGTAIVGVIVLLIVYYLVVVSRFPGQSSIPPRGGA